MFKVLVPAVAALGLFSQAATGFNGTASFAAGTPFLTADDHAEAGWVELQARAPDGSAPDESHADTLVAPVMDWHFTHEGETVKLAYGLAYSDQLLVMLTCAPGSGRVNALGSVRAASDRARDKGRIDDPLTGGMLHQAEMSLTDPVLVDLAETGQLRVVGEAGQARLSAKTPDKSAVDQFFVYCAKD